MTADPDRAWRRYHVLIATVMLAVIVIDVVIITYRLRRSGGIELDPSKTREIKLQLDPDTATAQALGQLPGLTVRQAKAIVQFRRTYWDQRQAGRFYRTLEDLDEVPGIGPKTLEKIREYLCFPTADAPDTP